MKCSRQPGWRLSLFVLLTVTATSAHATINMTGRWITSSTVFPEPQCSTFTQTGTSLSESRPCPSPTIFATGTIDSATGAFTVSDTVPACQFPDGPPSCTVSGIVAPDGQTFTATSFCSVFVVPGMCHGFSFPLTGARACTDDSMCDPCSRCDLTIGGACLPSPDPSCRAPTVSGAASLSLKTSGPVLRWKWARGAATTLVDFGDPVGTDTYTLCFYDDQPSTLLHATIPPGTSWRAAGRKGFTYKDKLGVADGVTTVDLQAGAAGKAKIVISAKGYHLTLPALQLPVPLTVQLRGHGECWGATYLQAGVKKNTLSEFVAKSSPSGAFLDD